jgi:hypothetical protein
MLAGVVLSASEGSVVAGPVGTWTWTHTATNAPGSVQVSIVATDSGAPPKSVTNTFTLVVNDANVAPAFVAGPDQVVSAEDVRAAQLVPELGHGASTDGDPEVAQDRDLRRRGQHQSRACS